MRELYNIIFLLTTIAMLSSCGMVFESEAECPEDFEENLTLHFSNIDNDGNEIFSKSVDAVDIFLFDENQKLKYRFKADPEELKSSQSATLTIASGTYRIVCWGNAYDGTSYSLKLDEDITQGKVYKERPDGDMAENGNPLYYAPFERSEGQYFTLEKGEAKRVEVRMRAAHIKIQLEVINYALITGSSENPYIEIANLFPKYDFHMSYMETRAMRYISQTKGAVRSSDRTFAAFNTPRFENDNDVVVNLLAERELQPIRSISLAEELEKQQIDVESRVELMLNIRIEFQEGEDIDVEVEVIGWNEKPIDPEVH